MPSKIASRTSLNKFNRVIYNTLFKRNSMFIGTIMASAFIFQLSFDNVVNGWFARRNAGKSFEEVHSRFVQ